MKKERCRVCGKKVRVQIQKNTGYCSAQHQEQGDGPEWSDEEHEAYARASMGDPQ